MDHPGWKIASIALALAACGAGPVRAQPAPAPPQGGSADRPSDARAARGDAGPAYRGFRVVRVPAATR